MAFAALMATVSCEDFLNRYPTGSLSSENMFESAELAEGVVTGVYELNMYGLDSYWPYNWDAFASVLDPSESSISGSYQYLTGNTMPTADIFLTFWKQYYEGINRANDAINNLPSVPDMTDEVKAQRIAECKFLRAWNYYLLNCRWRGVPIYLENLAPDQYTKPRSTEKEVWEQIVADLTECIECESIPDKYESGNANYGRVTRGAAYALRAKTYLWMEEWALAEADFRKVGDCGYKLFSGSYADLFLEANERCDEMIFSVQMVDQAGKGNAFSYNYGNYCTTGYGYNCFSLNTRFVDSYTRKNGKPFDWNDYIPGYNEMQTDARAAYFFRDGMTDSEKAYWASLGADMKLYMVSGNEARVRAAYADRDPRLAATAITPYSTYTGGSEGTERVYTYRFPYRDMVAYADVKNRNTTTCTYPIRKFVAVGRKYTNISHNPVDIPVIRYADVLLGLAEALCQQEGKWTEALLYVNMVRNRAGVAALNTNEYTMVASAEDLLKRIRDEKKWEFAGEQVVWYDELRWKTWKEDKFAEGNGMLHAWGSPVYTYSWGGEQYWKWPLPQSETQRNTNLVQNDQWSN